jgi:hypothetical protein
MANSNGRVRLSRITLHLKRLLSKANYRAAGVNAASDGALATINNFDENTRQQKDNRGGFNEGH